MGASCRSCGAAILWCETTGGKRMPLDAKPAKTIVLDGDGPRSVAAGDQHPAPLARVIDGYTSHFVTCPNAAQHRKRGEDGK